VGLRNVARACDSVGRNNNAVKTCFAELFRDLFSNVSYASGITFGGRSALLLTTSACRFEASLVRHGDISLRIILLSFTPLCFVNNSWAICSSSKSAWECIQHSSRHPSAAKASQIAARRRHRTRGAQKTSGCLLLAQSRHPSAARQCPFSGVKPTSQIRPVMSAFDPFRKSNVVCYERLICVSVCSASSATFVQARASSRRILRCASVLATDARR
jgi:hypothetical protein